MKKNSDEYEDIDQGVLNSDMPTGGLFASCGWAIYPKGGAIGPLFTFFSLDNYMKTDKVIINMMVLIKSYNKKEYCIATKNVLCTESSLYTFMGLRRQGGACTYDRSVTSCTLRRAGRTLRGHAPYVAHGPQNAFRTGSLIGRHLYLCTMTVVVT